MSDVWPRRIAATLAILLFAPHMLPAQGGLSLLDDASLAPRGLFRLRLPTVWTRYEQRFTNSGTTPLGAPFTADSLGPQQLPPLSNAQTLIGDATAAPFSLSLGRSRLDATAREEQMPITLEYGVFDRLSVSLVVPIVRKRLSGLLRLDTTGANVGPNPQRLSALAVTTNSQVQLQFANAAAQLQSQLNNCTLGPAACAALALRQAEAQALIVSSQAFATTVGSLYGKTGETGEAFVPRASSAAQSTIAARVADFNAKYMDLMATTSNFITSVPVGAAGPAGSDNLLDYVMSDLGRDSIATGRVFGIGDVELGVKFLAFDRPVRERGSIGARFLVASTVRFASATRRAPIGVADLRIGDGAIGFDARGIAEVQRGRAGIIGAATYTSVGVNSAMPPSDTRRISIDLEPRYNLTAPMTIHGSYALRTADFTGNTSLAGGGVSFTTVALHKRGSRPLPMEMRYSHLETIRGDVGAAKFTRDQVEVRIYYQRGR
jgi:hypothetical protein